MRWRPEPVNVARCVDVTCDGALPFVPNTSYSFGSIKAGSYRTYVCRQGKILCFLIYEQLVGVVGTTSLSVLEALGSIPVKSDAVSPSLQRFLAALPRR